jgi:hypothetical protein
MLYIFEFFSHYTYHSLENTLLVFYFATFSFTALIRNGLSHTEFLFEPGT